MHEGFRFSTSKHSTVSRANGEPWARHSIAHSMIHMDTFAFSPRTFSIRSHSLDPAESPRGLARYKHSTTMHYSPIHAQDQGYNNDSTRHTTQLTERPHARSPDHPQFIGLLLFLLLISDRCHIRSPSSDVGLFAHTFVSFTNFIFIFIFIFFFVILFHTAAQNTHAPIQGWQARTIPLSLFASLPSVGSRFTFLWAIFFFGWVLVFAR